MSQGTLENGGEVERTREFLEIRWNISNFFSQKRNYRLIRSPVFDFLGARWVIQLEQNSKGFLELHIAKMVFGDSDRHVNYVLGIKFFDGAVYKSVNGVKKVNESDNDGKARDFVRLSVLQRDQVKLSPQDVLIIFCRLSLKQERYETDAHATTQTEGGLDTNVTEACINLNTSEESHENGVLDSQGAYKLADDLKGLLLSGADYDTTIVIKGEELRAHRAILGARSSVFKSMFSHDAVERNTGRVEIEDCDRDVFQDFLLFLYSGKLENLSLENVPSLYTLADKYDVPEMKMHCLKFMKRNISEDSFCDFVALALRHDEAELLEKATDFFVKNTKKVIYTCKWQNFLKQYPTESNELYIKSIEYHCRE